MSQPQLSIPPRTWAEMGLLSLCWGGSFLMVAIALHEVEVFTLVALRVSIAMVLLWLWVRLRGLALPRTAAVWGAFLVLGFLQNALPFTLLVWAQTQIESGLTSILNATAAIFGVLTAAAAFADERLTLRKALGAAVGFLGMATAIGLATLQQLDLRSLAQLAALGASLSYACAGVWARKRLRGLAPEVTTAGMLTGATIIMVPLALAVDGVPHLDLSAKTLAAIGWYSAAGTALAYLLFYRVMRAAGSGNAQLVTLMVPLVAITLGALVLGEALAPHVWAGFGLLILGLVIIDGRAAGALGRRLFV